MNAISRSVQDCITAGIAQALPGLQAELTEAVTKAVERTHPTTPPSGERYLAMPELKERLGISPATVYRLIKIQAFPAQYRLSHRRVGWRESEVEAWEEARRARGGS